MPNLLPQQAAGGGGGRCAAQDPSNACIGDPRAEVAGTLIFVAIIDFFFIPVVILIVRRFVLPAFALPSPFQLSGPWRALEKYFLAGHAPEGVRFDGQYLTMITRGPLTPFTIIVSEEGLYLCLAGSSAANRPRLLPWKSASLKKGKVLWSRFGVIQIKMITGVVRSGLPDPVVRACEEWLAPAAS